jgi:hypothetical protein
LDKFSADKLDNLFKEKLTDMEIPLEEDYWSGIEKGLDKLPFYKFGWKHLNIYNISTVLLALLISFLLFFNQEEKKDQPAPSNIIPGIEKEINDSLPTEVPAKTKDAPVNNNPGSIQNKNNESQKDTARAIEPVAAPVQENMPLPADTEKAVPVIEEKPKPKPKRIIYVVQQDTIVEKDTVKVRRKKK